MDLIMVNRRQAPVHNYPPKLTEPSTHRTEDSVASHGSTQVSALLSKGAK